MHCRHNVSKDCIHQEIENKSHSCLTTSVQEVLPSLGRVCAVIGAQWGDEGKGKIVDALGEHFDVIARACGGANAGHTIYVNGEKHVFHLLPSGCLHEGKPVVLGAGMVIHLPTLLEEIQTLQNAGIDILPRLILSPSAHIVLNAHKALDAHLEEERSHKEGKGIGTTKRGIGPAYMDKAARRGLRLECLLWPEDDAQNALKHLLETLKEAGATVDFAEEWAQFQEAKAVLSSCLHHAIPAFFAEQLEHNRSILIEGAQATLLDIDHGTYPYVTSSSTTVAGALQGLGLAPKHLDSCIGVAKAYCTRVGEGRFSTEQEGKIAERLRERGGEYGATTGRPRRCGWLSMPSLQYAALINGFTHWNLTKLDVLDQEEAIPVATDESNPQEPFYTSLPGWQTSTAGIQEWNQLPEKAKEYVQFIEEHTHIPVSFIGTGPEREAMIVR